MNHSAPFCVKSSLISTVPWEIEVTCLKKLGGYLSLNSGVMVHGSTTSSSSFLQRPSGTPGRILDNLRGQYQSTAIPGLLGESLWSALFNFMFLASSELIHLTLLSSWYSPLGRGLWSASFFFFFIIELPCFYKSFSRFILNGVSLLLKIGDMAFLSWVCSDFTL